jgi:hypothetical protein
MTTVELLLLIAAASTVMAAVIALIHTVHTDGLGHRPPPRSHETPGGAESQWPEAWYHGGRGDLRLR